MSVIGWLLGSYPAIRWQVLRDLMDASPGEVAAERARVPGLVHRRRPGQPWTTTMHTLQTLRIFGLDPAGDAARRAIALVAEHGRWENARRSQRDLHWPSRTGRS